MSAALEMYGVEEACMESTSTYWMLVWCVLEPSFSLKLVNPYFICQFPGRKNDVKDAEWMAICLLKGLICGSYVLGDTVQQIRQYNSRISDLNKEIVRKQARLDAELQRCNIRLSIYMSNVDGKSYTMTSLTRDLRLIVPIRLRCRADQYIACCKVSIFVVVQTPYS